MGSIPQKPGVMWEGPSVLTAQPNKKKQKYMQVQETNFLFQVCNVKVLFICTVSSNVLTST
jgi:hypothetical protein